MRPVGDGPALLLGGRRLSYADLDAEIAAEAALLSGARSPVRVPLEDPVALLVCLYAARSVGRPAVVAEADPTVLPAGTGLVLATSGTAGTPRLVARTAASWTSSFAAYSGLTGLGPGDVLAVTGPLTSTLQLFGIVHALSVGATVTDDLRGATVLQGVPASLAAVLAAPPSRLRLAVVAGAALPDRTRTAAAAAGVEVLEYYGATELSFVLTRRPPAPTVAFPGVETRIEDGLLWVRSPYLGLGYADPAGGPWRWSDDGFATVGDLAEDGPSGLRVIGRGDAAITVGGATVLAEDVERVLAELPGVRAVAVVGVEHPALGQIVAAVLVAADPVAVRTAARRRLSGAALPRRWYVADALPHTAGKVARSTVATGLRKGTLDVRRLRS